MGPNFWRKISLVSKYILLLIYNSNLIAWERVFYAINLSKDPYLTCAKRSLISIVKLAPKVIIFFL